MSDRSRNHTFWAGSETNGTTVRVMAKRAQEELNCCMGRERIKQRYAELVARTG